MSLSDFLKKNFPECVVYSENDVVCVESGEVPIRLKIWPTHRVGIFSFEIGTIIVHLLNPELPNYNDEMMKLIIQILTNRGLFTNYRSDFCMRRVLFLQVENPETLEICVSQLGRSHFLTAKRNSTYEFTEEDIVSISKFIADPENYGIGRQGIYHWKNSTETLFECYDNKMFTAGPCETPEDSLFVRITSGILRFCSHVQEMRNMRIGCLTEYNMAAHMRKSYNTSDRLESEKKQRIDEFCDINHETFSPILVQEKDFSDVEEETGDETPSLGKRTRSCE